MVKPSQSRHSKGKRVARTPSPDDEILETDSEVDEFAEAYSTQGDLEESHEESVEEEGVGLWAPDDWDARSGDSQDDSDELEDDDDDDDGQQMRRLQKDLTDLPLSTLMKAQRALRADDESEASRSPSPESEQSTKEQRLAQIKARLADMQRQKGKAVAVSTRGNGLGADEHAESSRAARKREQERVTREVEEEAERRKRENKHAPMAMSSKKQVSRSRQVVEIKKVDRRDPRFNSLSGGQVDLHLHAKAYEFLPDLLKEEMNQIRQSIKVAQKAERTCKLVEKAAKTAIREDLEQQLGRLRTRFERGSRAQREREALSTAKKEEREKRKSGKGAWYMKDSEKRDLLLKSRFTDLESRGGKTAVKKAIEKKQKKIAGKEKKSRPFARGQGGASFSGGDEDGPRKRRRAG